ncbi:MAG: tRNA 2-thiouridine(34) synthase MnmA [Magnetococcales bacterium]|nr:tRNA 2-thiouridine(34) synthase MnmA [Magnetococcales bacterium]
MTPSQRIAVAMSGGVDSSTVAAWLSAQGWEVIGLSMHLWDHGQTLGPASRACCAVTDLHDARQVADRLNIPFYALDMEADFHREVVQPFLQDYARGLTPSPCIHCNGALKFRLLLEKARQLGAVALATGHYARLEHPPGQEPQLSRAVDPRKDQSYFLFSLPRESLPELRFPLGEIPKEETRRLAEQWGLHVAHKRESQDLCFIPEGGVDDFLARHAPQSLQPGEMVDETGRVLGRHRGLGCYTVGQRHGLGLSGGGPPLHVLRLDPRRNQVVVGPAEALMRPFVDLERVNWLTARPPGPGEPLLARIRSTAPLVPAALAPLPGGGWRLRFAQPQRAPAPGQGCALYRENRLLGGGWITIPLEDES